MQVDTYKHEIGRLAQWLVSESRKQDRDAIEMLDEALNRHQWVANPGAQLGVLKHCGNKNAVFESGTVDPKNLDGLFWSRAAYFAMHSDICEHADFAGADLEE